MVVQVRRGEWRFQSVPRPPFTRDAGMLWWCPDAALSNEDFMVFGDIQW